MTTGRPPPRTGARAWAGVAVMALLYFALSADVTVLSVAAPAVIADLAPSGAQSLWILHVSEFAGASLVITFGLLTARLGRRRLLLAGAAAFGVGSLLAASATSPSVLIGARILVGLAAAAYTPAALALLRVLFTDPRRFAVAFALLLSAFAGGGAAGPVLGGFLLEHFGWGSVFAVNAVPALLLLATAPWLIRRDAADPTVRIDTTSVGLSVAMVVPTVYGMQTVAERGPDPAAVVALLVGVVLILVFLRRQRRLATPLLDLRPFAVRRFRTAVVVLAGTIFWLNAATMLLAQYLQLSRGLSPLQAGALLAAPAVAGVVGTVMSPVLQRLATPRRIVAVALAATAAANVAVVALLVGPGPFPLVGALSVVALAGSLVMTLTSQTIVTSVPGERTGSATAVQDLVAGMSTATGIALLGSLAYGVYRAGLVREPVDGMRPADVAAAAQSPGTGSDVVAGLPGPVGERFGDVVADAVAGATQSVYGVAALLSIVLAAVALGGPLRTRPARR